MYTLQEFLMSVKAIEYLIAIGFIAIFIVFWQVLSRQATSDEAASHQEIDSSQDKAA